MIGVIRFDAHLHVELISAGSLASRLRVSSFRYSESFDCTHSLKKVLEERLETVIVVSTVASECQSEFRALIDTMTRFCIMLGCKVFRLVLEKYSGRQNINMPAPNNILVLNWFDSNLAHVLERALRSKRTADILEFLVTSTVQKTRVLPDSTFKGDLAPVASYSLFGVTLMSCAMKTQCMCHMQKNGGNLANAYFDTSDAFKVRMLENYANAETCVSLLSNLILEWKHIRTGGPYYFQSMIIATLNTFYAIDVCNGLLHQMHDPIATEMKTRLFSPPALVRIKQELNSHIRAGVHDVKFGALSDIFLWKSGIDRTFDLYRVSLCQIAEDIFTFIINQQRLFGFQSRVLKYRKHCGFDWYVQHSELYKLDDYRGTRVTAFDNCPSKLKTKSGGYTRLSCCHLDCLNARFEAKLADLERRRTLMYQNLEATLQSAKSCLGITMHSMKYVVCFFERSTDFCRNTRPFMNENGVFLVDAPGVQFGESCASRSLLLTHATPFVLVTGPSMSGKSTFIQRVAELTTLALSTRFINARHMYCPLFDVVFHHGEEQIGLFSSHFFSDLKLLQSIISTCSSSALVLLDEPCKSTSVREAECIMWVFLEFLLQRSVKLVLVSHLRTVVDFGVVYSASRTLTLGFAEEYGHFNFNYMLIDYERRHDENYGIRQARLSKLPLEVLTRSASIALILRSSLASLWGIDRTLKAYAFTANVQEIISSLNLMAEYVTADDVRRKTELLRLFRLFS